MVAACGANARVYFQDEEMSDASTSGADAGAPGGDEEPGSTAPDAAPTPDSPGEDGNDPPAVDDRLYPLAVGHKWTYLVESTYPHCPSGPMEFEVIGTKNVGGRKAFEMASSTCSVAMAPHSIDDDGVVESYGSSTSTWMRLLDAPVADGHTWTTTNGAATFKMTYQKIGALETDAGSFDDCWQVKQMVQYTQTWTYCRGVGMVASTMIDLAGGKLIWSLTSKNF